MRFDLQDIWRSNPKAFVAGAVVIVAAFAVLLVKGVTSSSSSKRPTATTHTVAAGSSTVTTSTTAGGTASGVTVPSSSYHPAYAKSVPVTPADQDLASALGSSGSETAAFEAVTPASPGWTKAYPAIATADLHSDSAYAEAFLEELLDRDYATQTRSDLARWVSAESAGEVVPGIPARAGDHTLYAELMEPGAVGDKVGPVPSSSTWTTLAGRGTRQHVYGLFAHPDSQWAQAQQKGLTSRDPLLGAEDVEGTIVTKAGGKSRTQHFSAEVLLGSALHHPGYGSWGLAQWGVQ